MSSSLPVKAVIFDIGATLVTGPPVAPNKVIAGLIGSVTAAEVSSVIMNTDLCSGEHACEVLAAKFGGLSSEATTGILNLWNAQAIAPREIDSASDVVLALKKSGLKIGLLSDIWGPYYTGVKAALPEVVRAADSIVLSFKTGVRKPNQENFLRSLEELGVAPEEAVMVGDTYTHDIRPALELGMQAVWVLARPEREVDSILKVLNGKAPKPTVTVGSITEVAALDLWGVGQPVR